MLRRSIARIAMPVLLAAVGAPHVRLTNPSNGNALYWQSPSAIGVVIGAAGSDDIADGSHESALRSALDAWNGVAGTTARLVENTSPAQRARTDWGSNSIHLITFDENNSSGYFPSGSGTVAVTPVEFLSGGRIVDADVLFNGKGYSFTTRSGLGAFDVADVATHELGHLLGLDHSGCAGASLYPYVSPTVILHRSLSVDDENGVQHAYPAAAFGSISGTVRRASNGTGVAGAHVVARDANGRLAAATLSGGSGAFTIRALESGDYRLYAAPLDHPISSANLASVSSVATDFQATLGASVAVVAGATTSYGDLVVGADVALSLGRNYDEFPLHAVAGATRIFTLHGSGLGSGCTLSASDPLVALSAVNWIGTSGVTFSVQVPGGAAPGHVDVEVRNAFGDLALLSGAIEVTPADPLVSLVTPSSGAPEGGDALTISGSGFRSGARVVLGSQVYRDGAPQGCVVVDQNTITLTTLASAAATYDVVVIDPSGVEGRATAGFEVVMLPAIEVVFPGAGSDLGGTEVCVSGSGFSAPMSVRVDGVVLSGVTLESSSALRFVTAPGVAGTVVLELEDAHGALASAAFSYVAQPDPSIADVAPRSGPRSGGSRITIRGAHFGPATRVEFGVDPQSGAGGVPAAEVLVVDDATLEVVTPAHAPGAAALLVADGTSGQATLVASAFTFRSDDGGGGGACATRSMEPPATWRSVLAGAGWIPLVAFLLFARSATMRRGLARAAA